MFNKLIGLDRTSGRLPYDILCDFEEFIAESLHLYATRDWRLNRPRWVARDGRISFAHLPVELLEKLVACASRHERRALCSMYSAELTELDFGSGEQTSERIRNIIPIYFILSYSWQNWRKMDRDFGKMIDKATLKPGHYDLSVDELCEARSRARDLRSGLAKMARAARRDPDALLNFEDAALLMIDEEELSPDAIHATNSALASIGLARSRRVQ